LHIVSDSKYVIRGLTVHLQKWEQNGWLHVRNKPLIQTVTAKLRARFAPTTFRWVKGHSGDPGNEGADDLAKDGSCAPLDEPGSTRVLTKNREYLRQGVQLNAATQRLLYQGVRTYNQKDSSRRRTENVVGRVCDTFKADLRRELTPEALWIGLKRKEVGRRPREFLWKGLHDALRVGQYWENIPTLSHRATCSHCGSTETLEHILVQCSARNVNTIWGLLRALATRKGLHLPRLTYGTILAGHAFTAEGLMAKPPKGTDRLMRIALTESAHLIWKLRCERVIGRGGGPDSDHTAREVEASWYAAMNKRLRLDKAQTSRCFGNKALDRTRVEQTWAGVVAKDGDMVEGHWIAITGVLVGKL
ncbi:hypothetical protein LXA43DRAFT_838491, partial [Ganoderma leucocontextum]